MTFGSIFGTLAIVGVALIGASEVVGRIEDRRNEIAHQEWVEKYGKSGWK